MRTVNVLALLGLPIFLALVPPLSVSAHDQAFRRAEAERREVRVPVQDFTLMDQASKPFRFASLRGKVVIVAFAYSSCPDLCPLITAAMRQFQDGLKRDELAMTHLLTITTDPEVDKPEVLAAYAARYGVDVTNWAFLTGSASALEEVWRNFGVKVTKKGRGLIDHTTLSALIDRHGYLRVVYVNAAPSASLMRQDVRHLLREK